MRRAGAGSLALLIATSFLVPCLGTCLSIQAAAEKHSCCRSSGPSLRAVDADCCAVTAGICRSGAAPPPALPASSVASQTPSTLVTMSFAPIAAIPAITVSPPLVLRI
jgi:hypothetical protein